MEVELPTKVEDIFRPRGGIRAECGLHVVGDPLHEVASVLVLNVSHLVLNLFHADLASEDGRTGEVSAVTEI